MTSEVEQTYYGWRHGKFSEQDGCQGLVSISQVIDRGSVSFGRFAVESLSWEKRSVFAPNERQEELEKFKSPGLVARKKAYFEDYYKKIRALKAMQNLQTELSLEYGADGSISSQVGDDDEPASPITKHIEMPEMSQATVEELSVEIPFVNLDVEPGYLKHIAAEETFELQDVIETYSLQLDNPVVEKNKLNAHKAKEISMPTPLSKEPATSARYVSKRANGSMSEKTKSSLGSKHLPQKTYDKTHDLILGKKTSCKPRSRDMSSVASSRSPTGLHNKAAVPRTVSVSGERKGTAVTDTRELIRSSQVSNRSAGKFYTKRTINGDTRELAAPNTIKNRALQSKSIGHEEFEINLENKCKTGGKRETTEQLTSRSVNLPSRNNLLNGVAKCKSGDSSRGDNKSQKKQVTSEATKSFSGGRNSRQEIPRWR